MQMANTLAYFCTLLIITTVKSSGRTFDCKIHSSLLKYGISYDHKRFYGTGLRPQGHFLQTVINTLDYYGAVLITALKFFTVQTHDCKRHFLPTHKH